MKDFLIKKNYLVKYVGNDAEVVIPSYIKVIGAEAFKGNINIKKVHCGLETTFISKSAFENCENLEVVLIGERTRIVSSRSFANCTALREIIKCDNLEIIGEEAFFNCFNLESVVIGTDIVSIEASAFKNAAIHKLFINDIDSFLSANMEDGESNPAELSNNIFVQKYQKFIQLNYGDIANIRQQLPIKISMQLYK